MIEEVEKLRPVLQLEPLAKREFLVNGEVNVEGAGSDQGIPADVAESVVLRRGEGAGREPLGNLIAAGTRRVLRRGDKLSLVIGIRRNAERGICAGGDVQREAALPGPDPRCLPSAEEGFCQPVLG